MKVSLTLALVAVLAPAAWPSTSAQPIQIDWYGTCRDAHLRAFALSIEDDRTVRYVGDHGTHVRGEQVLTLREKNTPRIRRTVGAALHTDEGERFGDGRSTYNMYGPCLRIGVGAEPTIVMLDSKAGRAIERAFKRSIDLKRLLCPGRYGELPHGSEYCEKPEWTFSFVNDYATCEYMHIVDGYSGGRLHYYVRRVRDTDLFKSGNPFTPVQQRSTVAGLDSEDIVGTPPEYRTYFREHAADLRDRMAKQLGVEWLAAPHIPPCPNSKGIVMASLHAPGLKRLPEQ